MDDIARPLATNNDGYGLEEVGRRGFVSLMDLYENNYIRFRKLIGNMDSLVGYRVSKIEGCHDLHLSVIEREKYTTTVVMTYVYEDDEETAFEPDIKLRIYHDAEMIEVLAGHLKHGKQRLDHVPSASLKVKWRLNRFLFKWLGFCLYLGHSFTSTSDTTGMPDKPEKQDTQVLL